MIEIRQKDRSEVVHALPEEGQWRPELVADETIDLLICGAGFEDRSTAILSDLPTKSVSKGLLVIYPTNEEANANAISKFHQSSVAAEWGDVDYSRYTFLSTLRQRLADLKLAEDARIVIDLSALASYAIYRVLSVVCELAPASRLVIYYAEAENYFPTEQEWRAFYESVPDPTDNLSMAERYEETHFQSLGVDETYDSDVFPGRNIGPMPTTVVAIPSFSLQRMKTMLTHVESQYNVPKGGKTWILGQPPDKQKNGWRYDALAALYNVTDDGVGLSTRDYREALITLDAIWEKVHADTHVVIAPLGSKMQHLGSFLFLLSHPECGLVLCEPKEFLASQYSTGIGSKWWIDFGPINDLKDLLFSQGRLEFKWHERDD